MEEKLAMNGENWLKSLIIGYSSVDIITKNRFTSINLAGHTARK
jgi:hypothetical protein